jgi:hypothetical protein
MSNEEWAAYAFGAGPDEIARWRYNGWPTTCPECGKALVYGDPDLGWIVKHRADGSSVLVHIANPLC